MKIRNSLRLRENFLISLLLGRKLVTRFVGKQTPLLSLPTYLLKLVYRWDIIN